jgi:CheY-like chemotaxis protein
MRDPRFLILDADPENRRHLGSLISDLGGHADQPTHPAEVEELWGKGQYDCVLVDRDVPREWRSVLEEGRSENSPAPLVFLTGPQESQPPSARVLNRADGYLPRGRESTELLTEHVRRAISRLVVSPARPVEGKARTEAIAPSTCRREHFESSRIVVQTRRIATPGPVGDIVSVRNKGNDRYAVLLGDYTGPIGMEQLGNLRLQGRVEMHLAESSGPAQLLSDLNMELVQAGSAVDYMTAVAVLVDLRRKRLTYSVAGHHPPLHRRWGGVRWHSLTGHGIPLGVRGGEKFFEHSRPLASGDKILLISDGFLKMRGARSGMLDCEEVLECIDSLPSDAAPSEVLEGIAEMVTSVTGGRVASDEITATLIQI